MPNPNESPGQMFLMFPQFAKPGEIVVGLGTIIAATQYYLPRPDGSYEAKVVDLQIFPTESLSAESLSAADVFAASLRLNCPVEHRIAVFTISRPIP